MPIRACAMDDRVSTLGSGYPANLSAGRVAGFGECSKNVRDEMDVEIRIADLRLVIERILDHIERDLGYATMKLDLDGYWDVARAERYDFTKIPGDFENGSLRDDWEFLTSILNDKENAVSFMLDHVAPLLRRIGEQIGK